jgi:putative peptide zinc metalloprotease protein
MAKTFSDNWYRIADLRLGLRPTLSVRLHHYRDEAWYVLHEPTHNSFHRVPPQTWRFLSRLRVEQTVEEIWLDSIEQDPENTPGQEDVFQLLSGMYRSNLIYLEGGADDARLIERGQQKKKKPFLNRLSELMFMRLPLFDPERWLQ